MMSKFAKSVFFILTAASFLFPLQDTVLVLPLVNESAARYDYIGELAQSTLYSFFARLDDYQAITPEELRDTLNEEGHLLSDLEDKTTLFHIAHLLHSDRIVRGTYHTEDDFLVFNFEIIDTDEERIIYRSNKLGKGGMETFETIDTISRDMIADFTGLKQVYGQLKITASHSCSIFIDGTAYGVTPFKRDIPVGKHRVEAVFEKDDAKTVVFREEVHVSSSKTAGLNLKVYSTLNVKADATCDVFINEEKVGVTPLSYQFISGSVLRVRVERFNAVRNETVLIADQEIGSLGEGDINLDYSVSGEIRVTGPGYPLLVSLGGNAPLAYPQTFTHIQTGRYLLEVFLDDEVRNSRYYMFRKRVDVKKGMLQIIDVGEFSFKRLKRLAFLPGAGQFYTGQYLKFGLIIGGIGIGSLVAAFSPLVSWLYYTYAYTPKAETFNSLGIWGPVSKEDVIRSYNTVSGLRYGLLASGLVIDLALWIYSLADSFYTAGRMQLLINNGRTGSLPLSVKCMGIKLQ